MLEKQLSHVWEAENLVDAQSLRLGTSAVRIVHYDSLSMEGQ